MLWPPTSGAEEQPGAGRVAVTGGSSRAAVFVGAVAALLAAAACFASAARAADRIYWSNLDNNTISFANLNGTGGGDLNTTGATVNTPFGVAINPSAGRIYWPNDGASNISFASLDGSGGGDLNTTGATVNNPAGIAIDPQAGRVYWANGNGGKISFANLDGSGGADLNTTGATVNSPIGVVVDPAGGRIYWANSAADSISFANLDGSGGADLNTTGAMLNDPYGVAIDPGSARIYTANYTAETISFANLDGSGGGTLNTSGGQVDNPRGVAVDPISGRIYWGNQGPAPGGISFAKLDGSGGGGNLSLAGASVDDPALPALLKTPAGTGAPAISGGSAAGSVLSCSQGSWASDLLSSFLYRAPRSFAYAWSRNGLQIGAATTSSYTATAGGQYRCAVTAANAAGSASQTSASHAVSALIAKLSQYRIRPRSFLAARRGPSARATQRRKAGAKVSFQLNRAASITFKVKQRRRGRKGRRGRCVKPTRRNRGRPRCTRLVTLRGGFRRTGIAGANSFRLTGRLRGRKLKPGRYRLVATPSAEGASGRAARTGFRIKRPPSR